MDLAVLSRRLGRSCAMLRFEGPVSHVYNPIEYAWMPHLAYLERYGGSRRRVLFVGMNPGPFGMAQTGVPFGDPLLVREFLGIDAPVGRPAREHPKRPVLGFDSPRREVSGKRMWTWVSERYGSADAFFSEHFMWNYCPLLFLESSGRNLTPNRLQKKDRQELFALCDEALAAVTKILGVEAIVAVGKFAEQRALKALPSDSIRVVRIPHPSGANPQASRNWGGQVDEIFARSGLD